MALDLRPPGGPVAVWSVFFLFVGPFFILYGAAVAGIEVVVLGAVVLVLGVGLWLRQTWARFLGGAVALFMIGWGSVTMSAEGVRLLPASLLFAGIGLAAEMWSWNVRRDDEPTQPRDTAELATAPVSEAAAGGVPEAAPAAVADDSPSTSSSG